MKTEIIAYRWRWINWKGRYGWLLDIFFNDNTVEIIDIHLPSGLCNDITRLLSDTKLPKIHESYRIIKLKKPLKISENWKLLDKNRRGDRL